MYEQLGQTYKNEPNCVVARVDADGHRDLGSRWAMTLVSITALVSLFIDTMLVVFQLSNSSRKTTRMEWM